MLDIRPDSERVLVCILAKTRAHDVTFASLKRFVLDELRADLALALTIDEHYDYLNPYWQHARYKWTAPEFEDYGDGYDWVQQRLCNERDVAPSPWRRALEVGGEWSGRIKSEKKTQTASAILPFCRWLLLNGLREDGLLERYDRFVITRSDFVWLCPHPPLSVLAKECIWVPDGQHWGGVNDRHMIVSRSDVTKCLNGIEDILLEPDKLLEEMRHKADWNDEQFLSHHLRRNGLLSRVRVFPYVMYTARSPRDDSNTWSTGYYEPQIGHFVKYRAEFHAARAFSRVIQTRGDWMDGGWRTVDPAEFAAPKAFIGLRIVYFMRRLQVWFVGGIRRPNRIRRLLRFTERVTRSNRAAPGSMAVNSDDYSRRRSF